MMFSGVLIEFEIINYVFFIRFSYIYRLLFKTINLKLYVPLSIEKQQTLARMNFATNQKNYNEWLAIPKRLNGQNTVKDHEKFMVKTFFHLLYSKWVYAIVHQKVLQWYCFGVSPRCSLGWGRRWLVRSWSQPKAQFPSKIWNKIWIQFENKRAL